MVALLQISRVVAGANRQCRCSSGRRHLQSNMAAAVMAMMLLGWATPGSCHRSSGFGLDIHHRYSDRVRSIFPPNVDDQLPVKGTADYFSALAHRDRIHGRRLTSSNDDDTPVTFVGGNTTYKLNSLGFLYYANVSVGTPGLSYLVALDTGSDLFWLPCDCLSCVEDLTTSTGQEIDFNIYSLNTSSTGTLVTCSNALCQSTYTGSCSETNNKCPYQRQYLSANTSSTGYLVQDVLHLTTDVSPSKHVNANITLGCGRVQTGSFLKGEAPNGLLGLGMDSISVPSILASENISANSFSMCFGLDGTGRINFGDQGSSDQSETPFIISEQHPIYNISITQISVGTNVTNVNITAICDTGTSFTLLSDPAYTILTQKFDSHMTNRIEADPNIPFEYCYALSSCQGNFSIPPVNFTMKGGAVFSAIYPAQVISDQGGCYFCLAVIQDEDINIIGENFMTGYHLVFDRDRMVLGWKASNCSYDFDATTLPISPESSAVAPSTALAPPSPSSISPSSIGPQATAGASNGSLIPSGASGIHPSHLVLWANGLALVLLHILSILW